MPLLCFFNNNKKNKDSDIQTNLWQACMSDKANRQRMCIPSLSKGLNFKLDLKIMLLLTWYLHSLTKSHIDPCIAHNRVGSIEPQGTIQSNYENAAQKLKKTIMSTLNDYEILDKIASGTYGEVFKAQFKRQDISTEVRKLI